MEDSPQPVWRKSDSRLITQSIVSIMVVSIIGVVAYGLYSRRNSSPPTQVLGSEVDTTPTHTPKPTPQALPTLPGTVVQPTASPSATPTETPHVQDL